MTVELSDALAVGALFGLVCMAIGFGCALSMVSRLTDERDDARAHARHWEHEAGKWMRLVQTRATARRGAIHA